MTFDPSAPPVPDDLRMEMGGHIREQPSDFVVEEIPLYDPSGDGEWSMIFVEKEGLTTPGLVNRLAREFGCRPRDVGWAGYKDRHAVTRQWLSVPAQPDLAGRSGEGWRVLEAARHGNKLKTGHLRGNRFHIRVRGVTASLEAVRGLFGRLKRTGLPNGFGPQRFGTFGRNHLLGDAMVRGNGEELLRLLSEDVDGESPRVAEGRQALSRSDWSEASRSFPRDFELERHVATVLGRGGDVGRALRTAPRRTRDFLVSAWQAMCFNEVLRARLDDGRLLVEGDLAMRIPRGRPFLITDPSSELSRARSLEIAASGPLPGRKVARPSGEAARLEEPVLRALDAPFDSTSLAKNTFHGQRRALRVPVRDASVKEISSGVMELRFVLPTGSFATSVLALCGIRDD